MKWNMCFGRSDTTSPTGWLLRADLILWAWPCQCLRVSLGLRDPRRSKLLNSAATVGLHCLPSPTRRNRWDHSGRNYSCSGKKKNLLERHRRKIKNTYKELGCACKWDELSGLKVTLNINTPSTATIPSYFILLLSHWRRWWKQRSFKTPFKGEWHH